MEIEYYKNLMNHAPFGYAYHKIVLDNEGIPCDYKFLEINDSFEKLTGLNREKIINKKCSEIFPNNLIIEADKIKLYGKIALECGKVEYEQFFDNLNAWFRIQVYSQQNNYFCTIFIDITKEKESGKNILQERERLYNIIEATNAATWELNIETQEIKIDKKLMEIIGYNENEYQIKSLQSLENLIHPNDLIYRKNSMTKHFLGETQYYEFEYRIQHKNGEWLWLLSRGKLITRTKDEKPLLMYGISMDISKRKMAEEKVIELSIRDPLTNVYNRRYIFERLEEIKFKYNRIKEEFSIAILDIDNFKIINDNFGHIAGDYILQEFTKNIQKNIRPFDLLGRYGGEEFIIIMVNCKKEIANKRLGKILEETRNTIFRFNDSAITLTFSAGIADSNDFDSNIISLDALIDTADKRLYKAKESGRNRVVISNDTK